VGSTIESLQPPKGNDKVKKIAGPKKIKSRLRDKQLREWVWFFITKLALFNICYFTWMAWPVIISKHARLMSGLDLYWLDYIITFIMIFVGEL